VKFLSEGYNLFYLAGMIVSGTILIWPLFSRLFTFGKEISTLEATQLINKNALIIDVREAKEFSEGRLPNAKNVPIADLEKRASDFKKYLDKPVIISSDTPSRANQAIKILTQKEFTQLYQLKGGLASWRQANLPIEK
jgi:rhodanese-related sulfurtransferase